MPTKIIRKRLRKKPGQPGHHSTEQRMEAVIKYMALGNLMEVSRQTKIPEYTLRDWKTKDWWKEAENDIRAQANTLLSGKLGRLIDKAVLSVEDRLDNGDFIFNSKTGKAERVGVKASVANQIMKDTIDKRVLLDKIASKSTQTEEAIEERLNKLQEQFLRFAKAKDVTPSSIKEIIDVESDPDV